jgi:hypothetical protein
VGTILRQLRSVGGVFDFTTMALQDPLSAGGVMTNNTQATGSNTVYGAQSSMRIIAAASGGINIATGDATGQTAPPAAADYLDSFAFLPGYSGNQRITGTVYVDAGYLPATDTHELEVILGCATASGGNPTHKWIECLWDRLGSRAMAVFGTGQPGASYAGAPNDFLILSPTDSAYLPAYKFVDGDVWRADFNRSTFTVTTYLNGNLVLTMTDSTNFAGLGDGIGIGMFRRTANSETAANRYGFKNVTITSF